MLLSQSKLIPLFFWIGFFALGFYTSFAAPTKTHPNEEAHVAETGGRK
jgi:hypothetical protein